MKGLVYLKKLNKVLSLRKGLFSFIAVQLLLLSSCSIEWFGDLRTELKESTSSKYTFYSFDEANNPYGSYAATFEISQKSIDEYYELGKSFSVSDTPVGFANSAVPGFNFKGWKYLGNPEDPLDTAVPVNIELNSLSYLTGFHVNYSRAAFYAEWEVSTTTPYHVNHYIMNVDGLNYSLYTSETLYGQTFTNTAAAALVTIPEGFLTPTSTIPVEAINPYGTTAIPVYYDRKQSAVIVDFDTGTASDNFSGTGYYQAPLSVSIPARAGYEIVEYEITSGGTGTVAALPTSYPASDKSYKAIWDRLSGFGGISVSFPTYSDTSLTVSAVVSSTVAKAVDFTFPDYENFTQIQFFCGGSVLVIPDGTVEIQNTHTLDFTSYAVGVHDVLIIVTRIDGTVSSANFTVTITETGAGL